MEINNVPVPLPNAPKSHDFRSFANQLLDHLTLRPDREVDSEYEYPGIDILSGVDNIEQKAKTGFFESHFDFESALEDLANSAHDGHLSIKGKSQALFHYRVAVKLASVSPDGVQIPKVVIYPSTGYTCCLISMLDIRGYRRFGRYRTRLLRSYYYQWPSSGGVHRPRGVHGR